MTNVERKKIDSLKSKGKRMQLEKLDKKLLVDDGRILTIIAYDSKNYKLC